MKSYPKQLSRFPYYEHLQIVHMFDTMHIEKNVAETLWQILDLIKIPYAKLDIISV